jgi:hypothetical protein
VASCETILETEASLDATAIEGLMTEEICASSRWRRTEGESTRRAPFHARYGVPSVSPGTSASWCLEGCAMMASKQQGYGAISEVPEIE